MAQHGMHHAAWPGATTMYVSSSGFAGTVMGVYCMRPGSHALPAAVVIGASQ